MAKQLLNLTFFLGMTALMVGCQQGNDIKNCDEHKVESCGVNNAKTNIRIKNTSEYDYCNVKINHGGQKVNYGIVKKGGTTCYRSTDTAYNFSIVFVKIRGLLFQDQVIKYKGKLPLPAGKYTYNVDVLNFEREQLKVKAVKD